MLVKVYCTNCAVVMYIFLPVHVCLTSYFVTVFPPVSAGINYCSCMHSYLSLSVFLLSAYLHISVCHLTVLSAFLSAPVWLPSFLFAIMCLLGSLHVLSCLHPYLFLFSNPLSTSLSVPDYPILPPIRSLTIPFYLHFGPCLSHSTSLSVPDFPILPPFRSLTFPFYLPFGP